MMEGMDYGVEALLDVMEDSDDESPAELQIYEPSPHPPVAYVYFLLCHSLFLVLFVFSSSFSLSFFFFFFRLVYSHSFFLQSISS